MPRVLKSLDKDIQNEELSGNSEDPGKLNTAKKGKKRATRSKKVAQKSEVWDINRILSIIFYYCDYKDLLKFNTVCKRWNQLTNPLIRQKIKLSRSSAIISKIYSSSLSIYDKTEAEAKECIINNAKHAHLVKEFVFSEGGLTRNLVEFFETFKFITILTINSQNLSESNFLNVIKPLAQLQELNLNSLSVVRYIYINPFPAPYQLPHTLTKLTLDKVYTTNTPESFIQTINSHTKLLEFKCFSNNQTEFLNPFFKNYQTLKNFEYVDHYLKNSQSLCRVFESNPQLLRLNLELQCWSSTLANIINSHLNNLEEFTLGDMSYFDYDASVIDLNFTQPTMIKKLSIAWNKLNSSSVESILLNCPDLETLTLKHFQSPLCNSLDKSLNLFKHTKIKNLTIDCNILYKDSFETLLQKCPCLEILDISLPVEPEDFTKIVGTRCANIKELKIYKNKYLNQDQSKQYYEELYTNSNFKTTLTHLTLKGFSLNFSAAEHFEKFAELKSIIFLGEGRTEIRKFKKNEADKTLWPNFNVTINQNGKEFDVVLVKLEV